MGEVHIEDVRAAVDLILQDEVYKIVISKPRMAQAAYRRVEALKKEHGFQMAKYTQKQVFHENLSGEALAEAVGALLHGIAADNAGFMQLNAWSRETEYQLRISKKGKPSFQKKPVSDQAAIPKEQTSHNKKKQYLIQEGCVVPPLIDMGIFTSQGKIVRSMYDKFRQINRFLELIDDEVRRLKPQHLNIIDFGCGKSYLTFILYYYLVELCRISVDIVGLDLKADVIETCNRAAEKYGYSHLHFEQGDINGYKTTWPVDMVITLHACDVATDYALYNAICWKARMIFSVPCCQHELNQQIRTDDLSLLTRYGIVRERFAALATDAVRANMLEYAGYKVQLLEFVDLSHTPKNILIRAVRRPVMPRDYRQKMLDETEALLREFHTSQKLYELLIN